MRIGLVLEAFLDRPLSAVLDLLSERSPEVTDLEVGVGGFAPTPHCDVPCFSKTPRRASAGSTGSASADFGSRPSTLPGNPLDPDRDKRCASRQGAPGRDPALGPARDRQGRCDGGLPGGRPGDRTAHFDAGGWLPYLAGVYERQWEREVLPVLGRDQRARCDRRTRRSRSASSSTPGPPPTTSRPSSASPRSAPTSPRTSIRATSSGSTWIPSPSPSGWRPGRARPREGHRLQCGPLALNGLLDHRWTATDGERVVDVRRRRARARRGVVATVPRRRSPLRRRDDLDRARRSAPRGRRQCRLRCVGARCRPRGVTTRDARDSGRPRRSAAPGPSRPFRPPEAAGSSTAGRSLPR